MRLLVLSRNYPNRAMPRLGLWTQRLTHCVSGVAETKVVAPVPFTPPLPPVGLLRYYQRFFRVERRDWDANVEVFHPRLPIGPGLTTHNAEGLLYLLAVAPTVRRLRTRFPFDIIHAHFTYPDGVAACVLGKAHGVPVVITEHAPWLPWMHAYPIVRSQATWAARTCAAHIAVSSALRRSIAAVTGDAGRIRVIPNVVDGDVFRSPEQRQRVPGQILFVGAIRYCKGVDILLRALAILLRSHAEARILLVGDPYYKRYRQEADKLRQLATQLGVATQVKTAGGKSPAEVAVLMAASAVVVLPSRAESFGAVLIEALACGTPVVSTSCGGPEDIVTPETGYLTAPDDAAALASAIAAILDRPAQFAPATLRRLALERFGVPAVSEQLLQLYAEALESGGQASMGEARPGSRERRIPVSGCKAFGVN